MAVAGASSAASAAAAATMAAARRLSRRLSTLRAFSCAALRRSDESGNRRSLALATSCRETFRSPRGVGTWNIGIPRPGHGRLAAMGGRDALAGACACSGSEREADDDPGSRGQSGHGQGTTPSLCRDEALRALYLRPAGARGYRRAVAERPGRVYPSHLSPIFQPPEALRPDRPFRGGGAVIHLLWKARVFVHEPPLACERWKTDQGRLSFPRRWETPPAPRRAEGVP